MATELTETTQFLSQNFTIDFGKKNTLVEANVELGIVASNTTIYVELQSLLIDDKVTPSGITVANTSSGGNVKFTITGSYGDDIATNHEFYVKIGRNFTTYYTYPELQAATFDHIIKFAPDSSHHKIAVYKFRKTSNVEISSVFTETITTEEYTHYIHMDPSAWPARLQAIVAIEKQKHEAGLI
jgi:hypothetical protein